MTKVVGVRFRNVGKIYYFSPKNYEIKTGDHVIVETARGIEYGKVVLVWYIRLRKYFVWQQKMMMKEKLRTEVRKEMLLKSVRRKSESMGWK